MLDFCHTEAREEAPGNRIFKQQLKERWQPGAWLGKSWGQLAADSLRNLAWWSRKGCRMAGVQSAKA